MTKQQAKRPAQLIGAGWNEQNQIVHLEGFITNAKLWPQSAPLKRVGVCSMVHRLPGYSPSSIRNPASST